MPKERAVEIVKIERGDFTVKVLGTSPLIIRRMSEKAAHTLLLPPEPKNRAARQLSLKHDPVEEFRDSPYLLPDGPTAIGLPSVNFKRAMSSAALRMPGATKSEIGQLVYVEGTYVSIFGVPKLVMHIVRQADMNRTPDVRTRAILPQWACELRVTYIKPILKDVAVLNLLGAAGMLAGVGDYRQQKGAGNYGLFELVDDDDPRWRDVVRTGGRDLQEHAMRHPECFDQETESMLGWYMDETKRRGMHPTQSGSVDVEAAG